MTVAVRTVNAPLDPVERQQAVFEGALLVFTGVEAMVALCAYVDGLSREVLGTADPTMAQAELDADTYQLRVAELQKRFRTGERTRSLLRDVLEAVGVDPRSTAWDRPFLRVSPRGRGHDGRGPQSLGLHRDTWASNVYSQTNWWAPIYQVTAGRTIAFHPRYWAEPLPNTSADWDLERVITGEITSLVPEPTAEADLTSELRVVPGPGDVLCFSGAHLHASVPNGTGRARLSVEVRTADVRSEATGQGAPNVDGEAPHVAYRWFRRIADGAPFADVLAGTEQREHCGPGSR